MRNRTSLALGLLLIALGAWFLLERQVPDFKQMADLYLSYPLNVIAIGGLIFVLGLLVGAPGMSVPAAIVSGIGGILYYQTITSDYTSWSYLWTLIPGFAGIGDMLNGALGGHYDKVRSGAGAVFVSAVLFLIFAAMFGKLGILGPYGPAILLIVIGVAVIFRGVRK